MSTIAYSAFVYVYEDNSRYIIFPDLNYFTVVGNNTDYTYTLTENALAKYLMRYKQSTKPVPTAINDMWEKYDPLNEDDDTIDDNLIDCYATTISVNI